MSWRLFGEMFGGALATAGIVSVVVLVYWEWRDRHKLRGKPSGD